MPCFIQKSAENYSSLSDLASFYSHVQAVRPCGMSPMDSVNGVVVTRANREVWDVIGTLVKHAIYGITLMVISLISGSCYFCLST